MAKCAKMGGGEGLGGALVRAAAVSGYPWRRCDRFDERGVWRGRKSGARAPVTYHEYNQHIREVGETPCGTSHVRPSLMAVLCDGHRRVTMPSMTILAKIARAPDGGSQGELRVTNNRTATTPTCLTSQPTDSAAPMTGDEQKAKLLVGRA